MHTTALDLSELVVFLVAAGFVVPLAKRFGVSPVLGFLAVGILIGPFGLGRFTGTITWLEHVTISDTEGVRALAELGVVFLLFMIGLELSFSRLWSMRRAVFGLGATQVVVTGVLISALAWWFGNPLAAAIILGAGFALSSTAVVMELMVEKRRVATPAGQTAFAVLLLQDLAVLPILFLVSALAATENTPVVFTFAMAMAQAAVAVAVILVAGRLVIRPLLALVGRSGSREMFLAAILLVVIGTSMATEQAGLSMALGAFLAGLLFSETEYRHAVEVDIEPFKGLLLALFFVSVGMSIDPARIAERPVMLAMSVVGLIVLKAAVLFTLARLAGRSTAVAAEAAILLGQGGEFAFLVIGLATQLQLLPEETAQFMLIVTGLTMVATPALAMIARSVGRRLEEAGAEAADPGVVTGALEGHVIIVGYGRVGRMLGSILDGQEQAYLAVELDTASIGAARQDGVTAVFGDARQASVLARLGAERATALVVTMDNAQAVERVVEAARARWPRLPIYARARDGAHASRLFGLGATHVIPEAIEASLQLSEVVLQGCGLPDDAARRIVDEQRQVERERLEASRANGAVPAAD